MDPYCQHLIQDFEQVSWAIAADAQASGTATRRHCSALVGPAEAVPRITRQLALALKFEDLIRSGTVGNYAALAQGARVTQMTSLLNLAPDIQEEIEVDVCP